MAVGDPDAPDNGNDNSNEGNDDTDSGFSSDGDHHDAGARADDSNDDSNDDTDSGLTAAEIEAIAAAAAEAGHGDSDDGTADGTANDDTTADGIDWGQLTAAEIEAIADAAAKTGHGDDEPNPFANAETPEEVREIAKSLGIEIDDTGYGATDPDAVTGKVTDDGTHINAADKKTADAILAFMAVFVPGLGALLKLGEAISKEDLLQGIISGEITPEFLKGLDSTDTDTEEDLTLTGEGGEQPEDTTTTTTTEPPAEPAEPAIPPPASLLTMLQESGTRKYLDSLRTQNADLDATVATLDPDADPTSLGVFSSLMFEQRRKNLELLDQLIGTTYGNS